MECSLPAPWLYVFVMHNVHFISTPIYIIALIALFRETSNVFQTYKYYIIAHIITNLTSEFYVTFMWLPMTYLPYEVYRTTVIGLSVLEMFHYRFKMVVMQSEGNFFFKFPTFCLYVFRFFSVLHVLTILWSIFDSQTMVYQKNKKDDLFKKTPDAPKELGCYSTSILALEDPILVTNVTLYGIQLSLGSVVCLSTVVFIYQFLNAAKNLSNETKRLQRMLMFSLLVQGTIHFVMIITPVFCQIYQMVFIMYDNDLATILLFCIGYHGLFSTCAMIVFTKQLRKKVTGYLRCGSRQDVVHIMPSSQLDGIATFVESSIR